MAYRYYEKLSARDKKVYDASVAITEIPLGPDAHARFAKRIEAMRETLAADKPRLATAAATLLVVGICDGLGCERTRVIVRATRPRSAGSELHGLYTRWDDGTSQIEVWMRTHARKKVVAFRTFLRTLLHEVCHHLDYVHFDLPETFHTEGFFQRESSLVRQLLGEKKRGQLTLF